MACGSDDREPRPEPKPVVRLEACAKPFHPRTRRNVGREARQKLIGLREAEALEAIRRSGCLVRVLERDGRGPSAVTLDLVPKRINLVISRGVVRRVAFVG